MLDRRSPILITGAAGFIGSHVTQALLAHGQDVVGLDNFDSFYDPALKWDSIDAIRAGEGGSRFELVEGDIRDAALVEPLLSSRGFGSIVHLAAKAGVRPSIEQPALYADVNVRGTLVLLEAARQSNVERFVLASSSSVYGNNPKTPFAETDDVSHPISPYAATKRSCELMAHAHHHLYGMPVACLRFFTVFGPRQRPDLAISRFMDLIDRGQSEAMYGDGSAQRDFTYIDDITFGVLAALDCIDDFGFRIWNLGGNRPISMNEVLEILARTVGKPSTITKGEPRAGDVDRTYADLERSNRELGYEPKTGFEAGVQKQWAWQRQRLEGQSTKNLG